MASKETSKSSKPAGKNNQQEKTPAGDAYEKTLAFGQAIGNKGTNAGGNKAGDKKGYDGKRPGWMNDDKYQYSDRNVQDLIKPQVEVPGVGGAQGIKTQGAEANAGPKRPQHKPKFQFKVNIEPSLTHELSLCILFSQMRHCRRKQLR